MEFKETDTEAERELKIKMLEIYNHRYAGRTPNELKSRSQWTRTGNPNAMVVGSVTQMGCLT